MGRRGWGVGELGKTGMISFRTTGTGNVNRGDKSPLAFIAISAFPGLEEHALCKCLLGLGTWNLAVKPGLRSRWSSPNCHFKPIVSKEAITGRAVGVGPPVQPEEKPTRKETNKPFPSSTAWRDSQSGCNDQDASSSALAKTFILSIQHWLPHQFPVITSQLSIHGVMDEVLVCVWVGAKDGAWPGLAQSAGQAP